jgi:hypothetical protein
MQLSIGDKVKFLNETGSGVVTSIVNDQKVMVETEDGFDYEHPISELIAEAKEDYKLDGIEFNLSVQEKVESDSKVKAEEDLSKKFKHLQNYGNESVVVVDLHIEELIDSHRGMSNMEIINVQMANFKRQMNMAINKKTQKLVVIHGVGEGVLKAEIKKELHYHYPEYPNHDASYQKYGYGATEILFSGY